MTTAEAMARSSSARPGNGNGKRRALQWVPPVGAVTCRFAQQRRRPAVAYLLARGDDSERRPDVPITRRTVEQLADAVSDDEFPELDVVIQSTGGDIHAAYQITQLLREHTGRRRGLTGNLVAVVPARASSAATLLCLGADEITLGESAALGPLDAQIRGGVTDIGTPDYLSALHLLKGLDRLKQFSVEAFQAIAAKLYENRDCRTEDLLKYSVQFSSSICAPLFERIESHKVGYWDQMLRTGEEYGRSLLRDGLLVKEQENVPMEKRIDEVIHRLVYEYPSHETILDWQELGLRLGLRAELMPKPLQRFSRDFSSCAAETLIMVVYPPGVEAPFSSAEIVKAEDWKEIGSDDRAKEVVWDDDGDTFAMRVGLYRPKLRPANPWCGDRGRTSDGGAATQYSTGFAGPVLSDVSPDERAETQPVTAATPVTAPRPRTAYARLDVDSHLAQPEIVVVDKPFDVTVGLGARRARDLTTAGSLTLPEGDLNVGVVLVYDPTSLTTPSPTRLELRVTADDPFPSVTVPFTALDRDDLDVDERRIGAHYLLNGQIIGVAWRTLRVVDSVDQVAKAAPPSTRESALLQLAPLLGQDAPDLILAVCRTDSQASTDFVWSAYPAASGVSVPEGPRLGHLEDPAGFATDTRRTIQFEDQSEHATWLELKGRGVWIGDAVPKSIQDTLHAVAEDPTRTVAATVLLLTEEIYVPWELAVFRDRPLRTSFGGESPFLGAHVAIGRWPLTEHQPGPPLRTRVEVGKSAVLTADYTGVSGWDPLPEAVAEASELVSHYPPVAEIKPNFDDVVALFEGQPPADVVHVALHGQFNATGGTSEGLVLIAESTDGMRTPIFLKPLHIVGGAMPDGPFVYLNACQVGNDKRVLGDYGGLASTLLRIGASGVIAPLWNINDTIAQKVAVGLYNAEFAEEPEPPIAEYLRRVRAGYTEAAAKDRSPDVSSTLIAYQFFGHPRLALRRLAPAGRSGDE